MSGIDQTPVGELSDLYVETMAQLDPCSATAIGIRRYDEEITDWSPTGIEARANHDRETLRALDELQVGSDDERRARDFMRERLERDLALNDSDETYRMLNVLWSPMHRTRACFDLMSRETPDEWEVVATRIEQVPDALISLRLALGEGERRGVMSSRRQALACAKQAKEFGGQGAGRGFFVDLVNGAEVDGRLAHRLAEAAARATQAYADFAGYLADDYSGRAPTKDGVGEELYRLHAPQYLGTEVEPIESYEWGWEEVRRLDEQMRATAEEISPGASPEEARTILETDPARAIRGEDEFIEWVQALMDEALDALDGTHFDIPPETREVQAFLAAAGSAAAPYYSRPAEDFSRPGRVWYPYRGRDDFPIWQEVTTCYHEAVPGHHLQFATVVANRDRLTRFQRIGGVSGNAEGWALYAERLMGELGFLEDPDRRFGMLAAQAARAARVVIDIGLHLELAIPDDAIFHPGKKWNPDLAQQIFAEWALQRDDFAASEIDRYLGIPGQAISYKLGEREWLELREDDKRRRGSEFDLKDFHTRALDVGCVGLAQLQSELAG